MDFAVRTAEGAGRITMAHFGKVATERKGDGSEVTAADRDSEAYILAEIEQAFPEDGVLPEEGGVAASRSGRRWVIDPIDATRSFASAVPLFGVLIAQARFFPEQGPGFRLNGELFLAGLELGADLPLLAVGESGLVQRVSVAHRWGSPFQCVRGIRGITC